MVDLASTMANQFNTAEQTKIRMTSRTSKSKELVLATGTLVLVDMPAIQEELDFTGTDYIILGTANYSTLGGTAMWGGTAEFGNFTITTIKNPNNIWKTFLTTPELSYWNDSAVTTATVSNQSISFINGQIFQTNKLTMESSNITFSTLSLPNITNPENLTYYLSANNGSNFEEVNNNTLYSYNNLGTNLKLKIVASGVASISIKDSIGKRTPIKILYG